MARNGKEIFKTVHSPSGNDFSNYNTFYSSSSLSEKFNLKVIRWVQSRVSKSEQDVGGLRAGGGLMPGDTAPLGAFRVVEWTGVREST